MRILLVLIFILLSLIFYNMVRDPLAPIERGPFSSKVTEDKRYIVYDGDIPRNYFDIVLETQDAGFVHFTLSLPSNIPEGGLPCVLLADGLDTGRKSLDKVQNQGNYAVIAFEYPAIIRKFHERSVIKHIFAIRNAAFEVPSQLLAIVKWIEEQSWYDRKPVNLLGFSFGAEFLPSVFHLAKKNDILLGPSVIAYGGADFYALFYALASKSSFRAPLAWIAAQVFRPLEPELHLPYICGEFLVINGKYDKLIPFSSALKMQKLLPEPKTIVNLETGHLKVDDYQLIDYLMRISKNWLEKRRDPISQNETLPVR